MTCKQIQTRLADYSSRRLPPPEEATVQRHLQSCQDCARFFREERALTMGLTRIPMAEPRIDLWQRVALDLDKPDVSPRRLFHRPFFEWRRPVAALVTGLTVVVGLISYSHEGALLRTAKIADAPPLIFVQSSSMSRDVDDPLADQLDNLTAAVNRMTQDTKKR